MILKKGKKEFLKIDSDGFSLNRGGDILSAMKWSQIDKAIAFKKDMFTTDLICVEFTNFKEDFIYAVNEGIEGFWGVMNCFKSLFPKSDQNWEKKVMKPPFERNEIIIYEK